MVKTIFKTPCLDMKAVEGTNHGLKIYLRIPVRVIQDHHVCCSQVDAQPSSSGAQHEEELTAVGLVKRVDGDLQPHRNSKT